jgi:SHS2 domain-containing protein
MYALMLEGGGENPPRAGETAPAVQLQVAVHAEGWEQLLVNFLAELLILVETEGFVAQRIAFEQCAPPRCEAHLEGSSVDFATEAMGLAVKAVTYHQIQVQVTPSETRLQVIFDI